jgi:hypothetical protein
LPPAAEKFHAILIGASVGRDSPAILSEVQTIVHGEAWWSAALQQVEWFACSTAERGLADTFDSSANSPDTVQGVARELSP